MDAQSKLGRDLTELSQSLVVQMANRLHFSADIPDFAKFQVATNREAKSVQNDLGISYILVRRLG